MDNVIHLPPRVRQAEAPAANTPRDRLNQAVRRLGQCGYETTADRVSQAVIRATRFGSGVSDAAQVGVAMAALASVPGADVAASRHARSAAVALVAMAFPFDDQPLNGGAA